VQGLSRISGGMLSLSSVIFQTKVLQVPSCTGESLLTYLQITWRKAAHYITCQAIQVKAISSPAEPQLFHPTAQPIQNEYDPKTMQCSTTECMT